MAIPQKLVQQIQSHVKLDVVQYFFKWIALSILIGCIVGSCSAIFLLALEWATNTRDSNSAWIYFLPFAGFGIGMIYHYFGKNIVKGNNQIIETINEPQPIISIKMAPFIFVSTIVTHLFGGSAGREGSALQMAASLMDQWTKLLKLNSNDRKLLLIASVAAGFGSVFGTPLAGTLFALEVYFIGKIKYNALFPALLSAVMANFFANLYPIHHTHYEIGIIPNFNVLYFIYVMGAGVLFGCCARFFSVAMAKMGKFFQSKIAYPPLRPLFGGGIVLLLILSFKSADFIGLGIPTIQNAFVFQLPLYYFVVKILFTVLTLSSGFKGGEVTPLFFIGATLGSALSLLIDLPTGLLAGIGFVAVFAGATNTPIACTIMAIELFGAECGIYAAIACVTSYVIAGNNSIYRSQLIQQNKLSDNSSSPQRLDQLK